MWCDKTVYYSWRSMRAGEHTTTHVFAEAFHAFHVAGRDLDHSQQRPVEVKGRANCLCGRGSRGCLDVCWLLSHRCWGLLRYRWIGIDIWCNFNFLTCSLLGSFLGFLYGFTLGRLRLLLGSRLGWFSGLRRRSVVDHFGVQIDISFFFFLVVDQLNCQVSFFVRSRENILK